MLFYTLLPTLLLFLLVPPPYFPYAVLRSKYPLSFQNLIITFAFLRESHLVCFMFLIHHDSNFPRIFFQSLSYLSRPSLLKPGGNIPCLETKANKILFSMVSHKIIKCYFFLLLPIYKEFLCLEFLFSISPILSFVHWNITPMSLQNHKLRKG